MAQLLSAVHPAQVSPTGITPLVVPELVLLAVVPVVVPAEEPLLEVEAAALVDIVPWLVLVPVAVPVLPAPVVCTEPELALPLVVPESDDPGA